MRDLAKIQEWYDLLVEDCKAIVTEAVFTSRWALVQGYWELGQRIREDENFKKYAKGNESSLTDLSKNIGVGHRDVYRAVQLHEKYPNINDIPEGKNITWNKLVTKYLPAQKETPQALPLIEGKYNVIYADPPWDIGSFVLEKWESPLEDKYPTMTEQQLMELDVKSISAEDCVLFLWSTLSTLPEALRLLEFWGFKYHITITWDKVGGWSSNGFHRRTELLLVGYKGILSKVIKQEGDYIPTVFTEAKREHSKKPDIMYQYIEDRTLGSKVELFARNTREGWSSWGNEV